MAHYPNGSRCLLVWQLLGRIATVLVGVPTIHEKEGLTKVWCWTYKIFGVAYCCYVFAVLNSGLQVWSGSVIPAIPKFYLIFLFMTVKIMALYEYVFLNASWLNVCCVVRDVEFRKVWSGLTTFEVSRCHWLWHCAVCWSRITSCWCSTATVLYYLFKN